MGGRPDLMYLLTSVAVHCTCTLQVGRFVLLIG